MIIFIKLFGILFGVLARTILPYLRKLKQGKIRKFRKIYWSQALASFVIGLIVTFLIFPKFSPMQTGTDIESLIKLFCLAFGFGFGFNSIIAEGVKWKIQDEQKQINSEGIKTG